MNVGHPDLPEKNYLKKKTYFKKKKHNILK